MKTPKADVKNIIVAGKSGAGKQPRIDVIAEELGLKQLSTGTIFRDILSKDTPLAKKVKYYVENGKWVPDEVTNEVFAEYFKRHDFKGCILDGFPRTAEQAKFLMKLLRENGSHVDMIIEVHREDEHIVNHVIHRRICKTCGKTYHMVDNPPKGKKCSKCDGEVYHRSDDTVEKIKSRLNEFHTKVVPAIEELKKNDIHFVMVNGFLNPWTPTKVQETVREALKTKIDL
ncbi:adenylate kinase [Candidatus Woesearchaeota archaeon]|jgi:adenylate kinase|nr:adenylate kinase [Candidatus Woesearchaeota archaeon]MBT7062836.1 adenylate kinase [Candidatus Woesearchaeota archaeon]MBT7403001.1 adenylate kinase [Candidatus Woesearchaeota archaeon]